MDEKKIIDVLMDDDTFIVKKREEEKKTRKGVEKREETEKEETSEVKKRVERVEKVSMLSEIERSVLRSVVFESKEPRVIARLTGYPEVVVKKALERLIDKGYLSEELEPTEKVSEVRWLRATKVSVKYGRSTRMVALDIAIVIAAIIFLLSIIYYLGLF
ncbi:MAG: hypothetical protein DRO98_00495 [Archaeoglobales archaeon]|nr:MAG: hypothetical protein DRO98_00495 [Archaeoglobales archaeon]